jgi:aryl-phospho-beta-D-glucosidase BglC (GH1 family)
MSYDAHIYEKYSSLPDTQQAYLNRACTEDVSGNYPTIVGEWSMSTNNNEWDPSSNYNFYHTWWAASVRQFEKQDGWIYWTWKTSGLGDPRWDYQLAVSAGIISTKPDDAYNVGGC